MLVPQTRFAVLLFTDIVGSTDLKAKHGVPVFSKALRVHNEHFERLAGECRGIQILRNMGDGYFAQSDSIAEAVKFALLFQDAMREGPWEALRLATRVGIHAGEITDLDTDGGSVIVAPAADLASRVMSLAMGGQILLTRLPFDEARDEHLDAPDAQRALRSLSISLARLCSDEHALSFEKSRRKLLFPLANSTTHFCGIVV